MCSRWYRSLLVLPIILLAACEAEPMGPLTARFSTSTPRGLPSAESNGIKYKDAGQKPSTGRAGAASLTVRALLGSDKSIELAITTGAVEDLDRRTGPGSLDKIQLKIVDVHGNHIATRNSSPPTQEGFASYALSDLLRGSQIQVQANISGIDPRRTNVVTVTDRVRLRPDLKAQDLVAPSQAVPYSPVSIGATVLEVNGDMGARADCVLSVEGAEVDRAPGIWVDAGSSVSCAFSHTFTSTGTMALKVAVTEVKPGDYDLSNNEVTGSITIGHPNTNDFFTEGSAQDITSSSFQTYRASWSWSDDGGVTFYRTSTDYSQDVDGRHQYAAQWGSTNRELAFPMTVQLRQASNGRELAHQTFFEVAADETYSSSDHRTACAMRVITSQAAGNVWFEVCSGVSTSDGADRRFTRIYQTRWAGEVTYFGHDYYQTWYGDTECVDGCWTSNWNYTDAAGMPLPTLGSDYTLQMVLTKDGVSSTAAVTVPLQPVSSSSRFPAAGESCHSWDHGASFQYYSGTACSATASSESGWRGYAFKQPEQ